MYYNENVHGTDFGNNDRIAGSGLFSSIEQYPKSAGIDGYFGRRYYFLLSVVKKGFL
jgi:hypothetical protein